MSTWKTSTAPIVSRNEVNKMISKSLAIDAIKYTFGYSTKEAEGYYMKAGEGIISELVSGYLYQSNKSFYED